MIAAVKRFLVRKLSNLVCYHFLNEESLLQIATLSATAFMQVMTLLAQDSIECLFGVSLNVELLLSVLEECLSG